MKATSKIKDSKTNLDAMKNDVFAVFIIACMTHLYIYSFSIT